MVDGFRVDVGVVLPPAVHAAEDGYELAREILPCPGHAHVGQQVLMDV